MATWNNKTLRPHMSVHTTDGEHAGHVAAVYEDSFLVHKGYFFPTNLYIPYSLVRTVEKNEVRLSLSARQLAETRWEKRPAYQSHLGDPTQLFYDQGHGLSNPFEDSHPEQHLPEK